MTIKIQKLDDVIAGIGCKILVYGDAGMGKTSLIASLPGRKLVVCVEGGLRSLQDAGISNDDMDVVTARSIAELREAYAYARKSGASYDWICLDSISEIAEVCLVEQKIVQKGLPNGGDPRAAYGTTQDEIIAIMRAFRDLTTNVYFTSKECREKDDKTGRVSYGLMMPGTKLGPAIPYLFESIYRLVVVADKDDDGKPLLVRWLQTANDGRSVAKDRSGRLDPFELADPTSGETWGLGAIVEKIRGTPSKRARKSTGVEVALAGIDEGEQSNSSND